MHDIAAQRGVRLICWMPGECLLFYKLNCPNYFDDLQLSLNRLILGWQINNLGQL